MSISSSLLIPKVASPFRSRLIAIIPGLKSNFSWSKASISQFGRCPSHKYLNTDSGSGTQLASERDLPRYSVLQAQATTLCCLPCYNALRLSTLLGSSTENAPPQTGTPSTVLKQKQ
ncbi:hypothetical protein Leryth_016443 [Lithospermum erythrorhizon]|nr:hypothetical protein Leryth_016443 [Lithospermum erythrorhizon]